MQTCLLYLTTLEEKVEEEKKEKEEEEGEKDVERTGRRLKCGKIKK